MKAGGGKIKGSNFEREVAKIFSEWSSFNWLRTPQSGGMREITKADLFCKELYMSEDDALFIECKKRKKIDLSKIMYAEYQEFSDWWFKTVKNAKDEKRIPVLIFTWNRAPAIFIVIYKEIFDGFPVLSNVPHLRIGVGIDKLVILKLSQFLGYVSYDVLKGFNK